MLDQLTQIIKQFGTEAIQNDANVPNEKTEGILNEVGPTIISGLQDLISEGKINEIGQLFQGSNAQETSNPVVQKLTETLSGNLGNKFGLDASAAQGIAGSIIPKVLGNWIGKAQNPSDSSLNISNIISQLTGGQGNSNLMDMIQKYGTQFGLDQNNDGKIDLTDAKDIMSQKGGIGGILGKLFGK